MKSTLIALFLGVLASGASAQAPAQEVALHDLLSGSVAPVALKLRDLDSGWMRVNASGSSGDGGFGQIIAASYGLGGGGGAFYTAGRTVRVSGETYLIAYRPQAKAPDLQTLFRSGPAGAPKPQKLTPDTTLWMSLLNLRTAGNLTDIRPFDLAKEMAESAGDTPAAPQENRDTSLKNLKQLGMALLMYSQDYDEQLPPMKTPAQAKKALMPYVKNSAIFQQPGSNRPYLANPVLSRKKLAHIAQPAATAVFYEESEDSRGMRGVVFLDGHAKYITHSNWARVKRASKLP